METPGRQKPHRKDYCLLPKAGTYPVFGSLDFDNEPGMWFP